MKEKNLEILTSMLGPEAKNQIAELEAKQPEFAQMLEDFAIEKVWGRPGLTLREKSMITLSSQVAMGRWDQVEHHSKSFLHLGGTEEDLKALFIHLAVYCGFPATLRGLGILDALTHIS